LRPSQNRRRASPSQGFGVSGVSHSRYACECQCKSFRPLTPWLIPVGNPENPKPRNFFRLHEVSLYWGVFCRNYMYIHVSAWRAQVRHSPIWRVRAADREGGGAGTNLLGLPVCAGHAANLNAFTSALAEIDRVRDYAVMPERAAGQHLALVALSDDADAFAHGGQRESTLLCGQSA
jgi:hypothetical protein